MGRKVLIFILIFVTLPVNASECTQQEAKNILSNYQWYAEDYPPYNYRDKQGELIGIFTDVLLLIYKELDLSLSTKDILTVPWARLYQTLENSSKHAAFNMLKTPKRDKLFQLVTLPLITKISILVLNENKMSLINKDLDELTIGVVRKDIGEYLLDQLNIDVTKVETISASSLLQMLIGQRIHAIAYAEAVANFQLTKLGFAQQEITSIYTLSNKLETAFIFHKDTPKCVTSLFAQTIATLNAKGEIEKISKQYHH